MGVVYRGRHAYLKTVHAIKVILPDLVGNDPQLVTRFRQEALAAAAIRHPNVVQVTDYGVAQGTMPFLVMEFVEGESLHDLLARKGTLSPEAEAFELVSAICAGIGAAHHQGIVHRDMKPLNIMILKGHEKMSDAVKILDFGLAKIKVRRTFGFICAGTDDGFDGLAILYGTGTMVGRRSRSTVRYLLDRRHALSNAGGRCSVSRERSIPSIMKKHLSDLPPSFAERGVSIAPDLERAVMRTLAKNAADRTKTVEDLVRDLSVAIKGAETGAISYPSLPSGTAKGFDQSSKSDVYLNNVAVRTKSRMTVG